jgi:hypothetical protein
MRSDLQGLPEQPGHAHVPARPGASYFDNELRLLPGVTIPLRSMLVELARDAVLISPCGSDAERIAMGTRPAVIVAPSLLHHVHLEDAMAQQPDATLWAPPGFVDKLPKFTGAKTFNHDPWPYGEALPFVVIEGAPKRNEVVFYHRASRTLYTADLVFNIRAPAGALAPLTFRAMGIWKRFAVARPWKLWVKDRAAFRRSIDEVLAWDFDRIAMAHGELVEENGRSLLIGALRERDLI